LFFCRPASLFTRCRSLRICASFTPRWAAKSRRHLATFIYFHRLSDPLPISKTRPHVSGLPRWAYFMVQAIMNAMKIESGTILIVDDDPDHTRIVQLLLARICPQLATVAMRSGQELISYLQGGDGSPDGTKSSYPILVLLDVRMPGLNGFDILRWLQDHPPHHRIPVVVLTTCGETELAQRAYALGARSFLTKPLRANDFENMVHELEQWIKSERAANPRREPDSPATARSGQCLPPRVPYPRGAEDQRL
jgi:CheY-like chemotaxis protein